MLRRSIGLLRQVHFVADIVLTAFAWSAGIVIFGYLKGIDLSSAVDRGFEMQHTLLVLLAAISLIYLRGDRYVYRLRELRHLAAEAAMLSGYTVALFLVGSYLLQITPVPRLQVAVFALLHFAMLFLLRTVLLKTLQYFRARGRNVQHTVVVGTRERIRSLIDTLLQQPQWGLHIIGIVSLDPVRSLYRYRDIPLIGSLEDLSQLVKDRHIDYVWFSVPPGKLDRIRPSLLACEEMGVSACLQADFIEMTASHRQFAELAGKPAIVYSREPEFNLARLVKELLDRGLALTGLVVLSPLLVVIALLIKLTSRGPVLFIQNRCGLRGKQFRLYKFRTMVQNAEELKVSLLEQNEMDGAAFKIARDPRITPLGRILRKLSLDELPQLVNVLKGDMSLVGPRPPLPTEVRQYDLWQRRKLSMKPGLTCLWQVGPRNDSTFEQWMRQDLEYIDNWSLLLDARILLRTIPAVINATGR